MVINYVKNLNLITKFFYRCKYECYFKIYNEIKGKIL